VAKIASGRHKPDSITVIPPGSEKEFLRTLDIGDLWGVGKVRAQSLRQMGLNLVGELADLNPAVLVRRFGESGLKLWELSNGLDNRAVEPDRPAKSLGAEETYPEDIDGEERISREILSLCVRVAERLRKQGLAAATVVLKVRDGDFRTFTRSKSVKTPFKGDYLALHKAAMELFPAGKSGPWRLLGVTATNLSSRLEETADLLASQREEKASQGGEKASLLEAMDKINSRPGGPGIGPAALIGERDKE
jgi:DNA polymerase-4